MDFNQEEYLKKFQNLDSLYHERDRIHLKYYIGTDQPTDKKVLANEKLHLIGCEMKKYCLYPEPQDSDEWINAWNNIS